jgi:hypothetical protein
MREGVVEKIRAAGGEVYAITSEPQHLADQAHEHWDLDFENVGDPHQEISRTCSERGWLTLYANRGDLEFLQRGADWEVEHPKGYFQPGVLALTNAGRVKARSRARRPSTHGKPSRDRSQPVTRPEMPRTTTTPRSTRRPLREFSSSLH